MVCCRETFHIFAHCGLVGSPHLTAKNCKKCSPSNVNQAKDDDKSVFEADLRIARYPGDPLGQAFVANVENEWVVKSATGLGGGGPGGRQLGEGEGGRGVCVCVCAAPVNVGTRKINPGV